MKTPSFAAPLTSLATAAAAITAARPTLAAHGVDCTGWIVGGKFRPTYATVHLLAEGAGQTVAAPTGGTANFIELWGYKPDNTGAKKWLLIAQLPIYNGGASITLASGGGYATIVEIPPGCERLQVAGTPSAGTPTFYVEPIEHFV